eukprot:360488-Chlamydomonas_euryale.AAC.10
MHRALPHCALHKPEASKGRAIPVEVSEPSRPSVGDAMATVLTTLSSLEALGLGKILAFQKRLFYPSGGPPMELSSDLEVSACRWVALYGQSCLLVRARPLERCSSQHECTPRGQVNYVCWLLDTMGCNVVRAVPTSVLHGHTNHEFDGCDQEKVIGRDVVRCQPTVCVRGECTRAEPFARGRAIYVDPVPVTFPHHHTRFARAMRRAARRGGVRMSCSLQGGARRAA